MLSVNEINLLEAQNKELKEQKGELQKNVDYWRNLYQETQQKCNNLLDINESIIEESSELLKERDDLKARIKKYVKINEQKTKDYAELKAKNERLKEECEMYKTFYRAKHDDIKGLFLKYRTCLQEIKGIATALYMNEWLQRNETARQSIQLLQELLDKAEIENEPLSSHSKQ